MGLAAKGVDGRRIYIFETTAGQAFDGIVPPRSTRIIVRLHDGTLDDDRAFADVSVRCASLAGAGVLSGFSLLDAGTLSAELSRAAQLARRWRQAGLQLIHLELASYARPAYRDAVLDGLAGQFDSLGMSLSELHRPLPAAPCTAPWTARCWGSPTATAPRACACMPTNGRPH